MNTLKLIGMCDVGVRAARVSSRLSDWECIHAGPADGEAISYMRQQARLHGVELRIEKVHKDKPDSLRNRAYCYVPQTNITNATCAYCGREINEGDVPLASDNESWAEIEAYGGHSRDCEWVITRAHQVEEKE